MNQEHHHQTKKNRQQQRPCDDEKKVSNKWQAATAPCLRHDSVAFTEFRSKLHASTLGSSMKLLAFNYLLVFIACATNAFVESAKDPAFAGEKADGEDGETCTEPVVTPTGEVGCSAKSAFDPTRQDVRSKLPFPPKNLMPGKPFPRVHIKDLYKPKNEDYLYRRKPFILTNAADDWTAVKDKF